MATKRKTAENNYTVINLWEYEDLGDLESIQTAKFVKAATPEDAVAKLGNGIGYFEDWDFDYGDVCEVVVLDLEKKEIAVLKVEPPEQRFKITRKED